MKPLAELSPRARQEVSALAALSFGGWCWREAERGDRSRLREAVAAGYAEAEADPRVPDPLVVPWGAWCFLKRGGELAEGSPGPTPERRAAFLHSAAERFFETCGAPVKMAAETARDAFYRGIALNDVERLALNRPPVFEDS
jgi:hypothetical protein